MVGAGHQNWDHILTQLNGRYHTEGLAFFGMRIGHTTLHSVYRNI